MARKKQTHRTTQKHVEDQEATDIQEKTCFCVFFDLFWGDDFCKICTAYVSDHFIKVSAIVNVKFYFITRQCSITESMQIILYYYMISKKKRIEAIIYGNARVTRLKIYNKGRNELNCVFWSSKQLSYLMLDIISTTFDIKGESDIFYRLIISLLAMPNLHR